MMKYDLIVRNAQVVLEDSVVCKDVAVSQGKIAAILDRGSCASDAAEKVDASGCYLLPGGIDTHTHFFEPGADYREDFACGTRAAASGGYTCIMEMPNSNPAVTNKETFLLKKTLAEKGAVVDYAIWAGATATNLDKLEELKDCGCVAFKAFTLDAGPSFPYLDTLLEYEAMEKISKTGRVFGFHAEDPVVISSLKGRYSKLPWSLKVHELARPYYAELNAINQIILFARETGCKVHICHLSIPEGAQLVKEAKQLGVDVTVESCSHYFLLNYEDDARFDTYALIQPPLRSRERMERMWAYLLDGTIDYLGTDHAPYTALDKEPQDGNKWNVIGGAPSIDTAYPLMFDEAVLKRGMSLVQFARITAGNAAKRFELYPRKGVIRPGADADLVIIAPDSPWTIDREKSFSKTKSTNFPYQNRKVNCRILKTFVRGNLVYDGEKICVGSGYGVFVNPLVGI